MRSATSAAAERAIVPSGASRAKGAAMIAGMGDATASAASSVSRRNNALRSKAARNNNRVATATEPAKGSGRPGRRVSRSRRRNRVRPTHRLPRSRRDSPLRREQESMAKADAAGAIGGAAAAVAANATSRERHGPNVPTHSRVAVARHALPRRAPTTPRQWRTRTAVTHRRRR